MWGASVVRRLLLAGVALLVLGAPAEPQTKARFVPRLETVAETRLLMQGISLPNFRGLERHLQQKPAEEDAWMFARGQALLIAENGNLLLLRPPRNAGENSWQELSVALRSAATRLARTIADRDVERSRAGLAEVAQVCNRCHLTFRVATRLNPFAEP
jgi:hypothetical protein